MDGNSFREWSRDDIIYRNCAMLTQTALRAQMINAPHSGRTQ